MVESPSIATLELLGTAMKNRGRKKKLEIAPNQTQN